ncbi:DNA methyltransferase [Dactylosporangium sp. AC04546]|uniref:DNA methyltransferase n=1 Tax=Dactylosporangium sp. AC04546 TaxID=2862460 RepID=UPI001EDE784E|nr:DNA methyltransferase [Dactylosporangium sp. AC04546]WVK82716.1 DNA methyltransferase [Dactylosporangium sp. AC04546]
MSFESLTNRGEYLSAHYLAEVLPTTLKGGLFKRWADEEKAGRATPRAGLRHYRRDYFNAKTELADLELFDPERLRKLHNEILTQLGFEPKPQTITVERGRQDHQIQVAHADLAAGHGIVAIDCGWAVDTDAAQDPTDAGRLLQPVTLADGQTIETGAKLASWLLAADSPPRYVLILSGGVLTLADRSVWGEGRYLAVSLDIAYGRNDDKELDVIAALFGADSLRPTAEGGTEPLADLVAGSRQHASGVDSELREGLRVSVELIANEVLDRIRQAGYQPQQVMDLDELAKDLGREALRYLYRILFLLYAEARPELGVLPVNDPEYVDGYSLGRLGELISRRMAPSAEGGFHLYESLDLLFRMVNKGHRERGSEAVDERASEDIGLRFEPMRSNLFLPEYTKLIGRLVPQPGSDPDDPAGPKLDTRLRNATLYQVLRRLMLRKGNKKGRGGFISYAQLGINQLGAVYEGLMSYTGFVATEQLYEVAKNGDPKDGSWMIPASKVDEYDDAVFVYKENPYTGVRSRVTYEPGSFVYRLAGRDRQTSASYYTPQSLTEVTVQLALKYRLDQNGTVTLARELLNWTICEPALGSGAFLNEAINQVAAEYLRRRQKELDKRLDPEQYHLELQRVKAYIALHNCYGVDLNRTAVELAEVSLWLNVMHAGLQAPWFGLHLQRGNSLIGGRRQTYTPKQLADKSWLTTAPKDQPFREGPIDEGTIHHFLLPADGWGVVAGEKEARELAPTETEKFKKWRAVMKRVPTARGRASQVARLQALARRVEYLWHLVQRRLEISEREIRRDIKIWEAQNLPKVTEAVPREKIVADLTRPGTPYWRLKTLMDVWCSLWYWPLDKVGLLDGSDTVYPAEPVEVTHVKDLPVYDEPESFAVQDLFGQTAPQQLELPTKPTGIRKMTLAEQLRMQVPLADLDDWLTFAEALIGRSDIPPDSLVSDFESLSELGDYEGDLVGLMGMDESYRLADRFSWLQTAEAIAEQHGFFHWELTFAQTFAKGGFDLQMGNPPWVRPRWQEDVILAELEPWFMLADKPSVTEWQRRKCLVLTSTPAALYFLSSLAANAGTVAILGSAATYPLLAGTQADLYRAFICRVWGNLGASGAAGMVHPDTHFGGVKEGRLRAAVYKNLLFHAHFSNRAGVFPEVHANTEFGIHIYGARQSIEFTHTSWLFAPRTLVDSLQHDGSGDVPGIKHEGKWELRPHRSRLIKVDEKLLAQWQRLSGGDSQTPISQTPLLYPVTVEEQGAIAALSRAEHRLGAYAPRISRGYDEANGKKDGLIRWSSTTPESLHEVILQGPHLSVATPFSKQPNNPCKTNRDWSTWDITGLPEKVIPRTNYVRASDRERWIAAQDVWDRRPYTEFFRLAWRRMIPFDTERSLFAALIPPGPSHVNAVHSLAAADNLATAIAAGFWSALPLDYLLRAVGRADLQIGDAPKMPTGSPQHPLVNGLLLRTMRLHCLTADYASLWAELFRSIWAVDTWAIDWPGVPDLGSVTAAWDRITPLRSECARRSALVELDSLVAVWLEITADQLVAVYRSRYPILLDYERETWFDKAGRRIARSHHAFGYGQTKEHYEQLMAYFDDPERNPVPEGYVAPFYKADRESEYRQAHAVFSKRLQDAIDAGWTSS